MSEDFKPPILDHAVELPSAFTAKRLIEDVRRNRKVPHGDVPPVCMLEFDGDLTDWLIQNPRQTRSSWRWMLGVIILDGHCLCGIYMRA
jgi:hypothetical protein